MTPNEVIAAIERADTPDAKAAAIETMLWAPPREFTCRSHKRCTRRMDELG